MSYSAGCIIRSVPATHETPKCGVNMGEVYAPAYRSKAINSMTRTMPYEGTLFGEPDSWVSSGA